MPHFTLAQKIFIVKAYYSSGDSAQDVIRSLKQRYSIALSEDKENISVVRLVVTFFERNGSVMNTFNYKESLCSSPTTIPIQSASKQVEQETQPPEEKIPEQEIEEVVNESEEKIPEQEIQEVVNEDLQEFEEDIIEEDSYSEPDPNHEENPENEEELETQKKTEDLKDEQKQDKKPTKVKAKRGRPKKEFSAIKPKVNKDPFIVCPICGKQVPRYSLSHHKRYYHMDLIFKCDICDKICRSKFSLDNHKKIHMLPEERAIRDGVVCDICGKVSMSRQYHIKHMIMHSDEKPFACSFCPMRFRRVLGKQNHERTHTGERPLQCKECGECFAVHMTLKLHMRTHTGERPYVCPHCDRRFIGQASLNTHLKSSHPESEYSFECQICQGRYKTSKTLSEHMEKKHGETQKDTESMQS